MKIENSDNCNENKFYLVMIKKHIPLWIRTIDNSIERFGNIDLKKVWAPIPLLDPNDVVPLRTFEELKQILNYYFNTEYCEVFEFNSFYEMVDFIKLNQ